MRTPEVRAVIDAVIEDPEDGEDLMDRLRDLFGPYVHGDVLEVVFYLIQQVRAREDYLRELGAW